MKKCSKNTVSLNKANNSKKLVTLSTLAFVFRDFWNTSVGGDILITKNDHVLEQYNSILRWLFNPIFFAIDSFSSWENTLQIITWLWPCCVYNCILRHRRVRPSQPALVRQFASVWRWPSKKQCCHRNEGLFDSDLFYS